MKPKCPLLDKEQMGDVNELLSGIQQSIIGVKWDKALAEFKVSF